MKNKNDTIGFLVIVCLLAVTSLFSMRLFFQQKTAHDKLDIRTFPRVLDGWKGTDLEITEREYKILETRNLIMRDYANSSKDRLSLFIIYSETNRSVFHPPEVCLVGGGLDITDKRVEEMDIGRGKCSVNKLYAEKGSSKDIILYCYKAGDLYTSSYYVQQAYLALHQIFGKRVPGATIRLWMPIKGNEQKTLAILKPFLTKVIKILDNIS